MKCNVDYDNSRTGISLPISTYIHIHNPTCIDEPSAFYRYVYTHIHTMYMISYDSED